MSTNTARIGALETRMDAIDGKLDLLLARLAPQEPARTVTPAKAEPKAEKAYRSAAGKERAKAQVSALWTKTLADAGVTKRAQLTDAQFEAYQAGAKAIWAAVPKTRATKAPKAA
jgi:hypothetical protein